MSRSSIVRRPAVAARYAGSGGPSSAVIGRNMRAELSDMLKEIMLTSADAIEASCPIDTGHLVSNFILHVGSPFTGIAGSRDAVSYAEQDAGREKVLAYDIGRDGKIYYTNNVEYLKYLPPFVTEALQAGVAAAPHGHKTSARRLLKTMAREAFKKGA